MKSSFCIQKRYIKQCSIQGFTLIELMITLIIVSILMAIAIPNYQSYVRKKDESQVMQAMQAEAIALERFKTRNFSYRGYKSSNPILPTSYSSSLALTNSDGGEFNNSNGQSWAIKASTNDPKNYYILLTSTGVRCKNTTDFSSYTDCGTGAEAW